MTQSDRTATHDSIAGLDGPVELYRRAPRPDLAACYTGITGYREHFQGTARQLETASLTIPLIVSFGRPFEIALGHEPGADDGIPSFIAGLYDGPVHIRSHGTSHCLQIDFTPLGARRFFGLPMSELTARMIPVADFGDRRLGDLSARLAGAPDWETRFDIAEQAVTGRLVRAAAPAPEIAWAFTRLGTSHGTLPVAALAREIGWSRKHLVARFNAEVGMAPKAIARIMRFTRAQRLARHESAGWADIAAASGYADQAHLIRDFHQFAGLTPQAWRGTQPG